MPSVPAGTSAFPVVTASAATGILAKSANLESTEISIGANTLGPVRVQSRVSWEIESEFAMPQFREALLSELRRALREQLDKLAISGKDSSPAVEGFTRTLTPPVIRARQAK